MAYEGHFTSRRGAARGAPAIEFSSGAFRWPEVIKDSGGRGGGRGGGKGGGGRGGGGGGRGGGKGAAAGGESANAAPRKPGVLQRKARRELAAEAQRKAAEAAAKDAARPPTLDGISFKVAQGSFVGVCGPVGCGKSSLLASVLGE
jgi:ABC-type multidrug transport system fused ATPase/permease subunit